VDELYSKVFEEISTDMDGQTVDILRLFTTGRLWSVSTF